MRSQCFRPYAALKSAFAILRYLLPFQFHYLYAEEGSSFLQYLCDSYIQCAILKLMMRITVLH